MARRADATAPAPSGGRGALVTGLGVAVPLIAAAAVGPVFGLRDSVPGWSWAFWSATVLLLLVAVCFQVAQKLRERRRTRGLRAASDELRLRLRDELMPVASTLAEMAAMPVDERVAYLKAVAVQAVGALRALTEGHVDRVRAVVYLLDADAAQMEALAHSGRGEKPGPFIAGTPRGDEALRFVAGTTTDSWPDLRRQKPPGYEGTMSGYDTFVAVPIWTANGHYGMVTLDAPRANSFTAGDVSLTELVAELMTVPFEIAQDGRSGTDAEVPDAQSR